MKNPTKDAWHGVKRIWLSSRSHHSGFSEKRKACLGRWVGAREKTGNGNRALGRPCAPPRRRTVEAEAGEARCP